MSRNLGTILESVIDENAGAFRVIGDTGKRVSKSADTSRASTTTIAVDPHLSIPVTAGKTYKGRAMLFFTNGTGGLKLDLSGGDATFTRVKRISKSFETAGTAPLATQKNTDVTTDFNANAADKVGWVELEFVVVINAAGTFALAWAQQASDADNTTLEQDSWLELQEYA